MCHNPGGGFSGELAGCVGWVWSMIYVNRLLPLSFSCILLLGLLCCSWGDSVSKKEKLLTRLKASPKGFTFDEMRSLLELLGFEMSNKGRTSGSRVKFLKGNIPITLHKPHPRKELAEYQIKQIITTLEEAELI